jgi:hypothetical protein
MQNLILPALITILSFASHANETHELAEQGRWAEAGLLIQSGKYNIDEKDERGLSVDDIALNRGELEELETHYYAHLYDVFRKCSVYGDSTEPIRIPIEPIPHETEVAQSNNDEIEHHTRSGCFSCCSN